PPPPHRPLLFNLEKPPDQGGASAKNKNEQKIEWSHLVIDAKRHQEQKQEKKGDDQQPASFEESPANSSSLPMKAAPRPPRTATAPPKRFRAHKDILRQLGVRVPDLQLQLAELILQHDRHPGRLQQGFTDQRFVSVLKSRNGDH